MTIKSIANAGDTNVTEEGFVKGALRIVSLPVKAISDDGSFISSSAAGIGMIGSALVGGLVGEAYGHKRERDGKQSYVPIWR